MRPPYPAQTMLRARELHQAGWGPTEIKRRLGIEGHGEPSVYTIRMWTNPKYRKAQHAAHRRYSAARTVARSDLRWPGQRSVEWKLARMRRLREEVGLSHADIARLMTFDFPDTPLSAWQVEGALKDGRMPQPFSAARRAAA